MWLLLTIVYALCICMPTNVHHLNAYATKKTAAYAKHPHWRFGKLENDCLHKMLPFLDAFENVLHIPICFFSILKS